MTPPAGPPQLLPPPAKLQAARVLVSKREPYLADGLWRLSLHVLDPWPVSAGEVACNERGQVVFSARVVEASTVEQLAGALVHELAHLLRLHAARRGGREPLPFNVAGDAAINPDVLDVWPLPYECVLPQHLGQLRGLTAEQYYDALPIKREEHETRCGSCAGNEHPAEEWLPASASPGDAADEETQRDWSPTAAQVAHAIREAAKTRGDVPAGWQRWAGNHVAGPQPDWRRILAMTVRAELRASGAFDYSYARPKLRSGILLPSLRSPTIRAAIGDDTSGSMSDAQAAANLDSVEAICRTAGCREVRYIACDAAVHADVTVRSGREARRHQKGGGGTDMGRAIEAAARKDRHGHVTDICIVLTDGYTPWPVDRPRCMRVVACVPTGGPATPAWARRVELPTNSKGV